MVATKQQSLVVIIDVVFVPMLAICANSLASSGSVIVSLGNNDLNWFVNTALLGGVLLLPLKEGKSVGCCPAMLVSSSCCGPVVAADTPFVSGFEFSLSLSEHRTIFNVSSFEIFLCFGD